MNNIEKYSKTKDALEAYEEYRNGGGVLPLSKWLDCEYEDPHVHTLLEAAEAVCDVWEKWNGGIHSFEDRIRTLRSFIEREKRKPVRNLYKYSTEKEAFASFSRFCNNTCSECRFRDKATDGSCTIAWLYSDAEKEVEVKE